MLKRIASILRYWSWDTSFHCGCYSTKQPGVQAGSRPTAICKIETTTNEV